MQQTNIDPKAYALLAPGDLAPWFRQRCSGNPTFALDTAAGRWLVLCFYGSADDPIGKATLDAVTARRAMFNDERISFFGVSLDPRDESEGRAVDIVPGIRHFWDFNGEASKRYGAAPRDWTSGPLALRRVWFILDPAMRVHAIVPFQNDGAERDEVFAILESLPAPAMSSQASAPILMLPNVFEPAFCNELIALYEKEGGQESGFMREVNGSTVAMVDYSHKRRRDHNISDTAIIQQSQARILRRIVPQIERAYQFSATRMERYIVACYAADEQAHFRPHRDNTTKGTAHRRFAVSINLNNDFEGGEISFPEYGTRSYKPEPGMALVFSCSMLHAVSPMTRGKRYAFLPFLYDEPAAVIREANNKFLGEDLSRYKA